MKMKKVSTGMECDRKLCFSHKVKKNSHPTLTGRKVHEKRKLSFLTNVEEKKNISTKNFWPLLVKITVFFIQLVFFNRIFWEKTILTVTRKICQVLYDEGKSVCRYSGSKCCTQQRSSTRIVLYLNVGVWRIRFHSRVYVHYVYAVYALLNVLSVVCVCGSVEYVLHHTAHVARIRWRMFSTSL